MADATDTRLIAAHLAAALIKQVPMAQAKGTAAENAAKLYFDVLEAVRAEDKDRSKPASAGFGKQG